MLKLFGELTQIEWDYKFFYFIYYYINRIINVIYKENLYL